MQKTELEKTKEELNKQKTQNEEQINIIDERVRMSKVNQLDYKLAMTLIFSIIPYFTLIVLGMFSDMSFLINFMPKEIIPIITTVSSLGIGTLLNCLLYKKYKVKERFLSFSKAKTETEKIEEEIYYQIGLEKTINRNKVIEETIDTLDSNQIFLKIISSKYHISEKNTSLTEEEAKQRLEELSKILAQKYNELDVLTTKKVLNDNFRKIRTKIIKIMNTIANATFGGLLTLLFVTFVPFITTDSIFENCSMLIREIYFLAPLITGAIGTTAYSIKRNINRKKAFVNLNNTLGENALSETIKFENNETQELEELIEKLINDISFIEVEFRKQKRTVENIAQTEEQEESTEQKIINSLGRNSVENILNDKEPIEGIYRPAYEMAPWEGPQPKQSYARRRKPERKK